MLWCRTLCRIRHVALDKSPKGRQAGRQDSGVRLRGAEGRQGGRDGGRPAEGRRPNAYAYHIYIYI